MKACANVELHENRCRHRFNQAGRFWRVNSADGCVATVCGDCLLAGDLNDVVSIAMLDSDGIPLDERAWTYADTAANLGRELLRKEGRR